MVKFVSFTAGISTTSGTSDWVISGAGFNADAFADSLADGEEYEYVAVYTDGVTLGWEVGIGTWTLGTTTFSRDTVYASSNSHAKVSFSAASKTIEITVPALRYKTFARFIASSNGADGYLDLTGAVNNSNKVFTVPGGIYDASSLIVYIGNDNNAVLVPGVVATTPSSGVFTTPFAPRTDGLDGVDRVIAFYHE